MKTLFLFASLVLCLPRQNHPVTASAISNDNHTLIDLKKKKESTDKYLKQHSKEVIVLVKVPGKKELVYVKGENWPDEIEYTYNILKNKSGKVILIVQSPFSESGDWDIDYKHYFDDNGCTYCFEKNEFVFDDRAKGGAAIEKLYKYYDAGFKLTVTEDKLTDKDDKPLHAIEGGFDFREFPYKIYENVDDCLKAYNIKL